MIGLIVRLSPTLSLTLFIDRWRFTVPLSIMATCSRSMRTPASPPPPPRSPRSPCTTPRSRLGSGATPGSTRILRCLCATTTTTTGHSHSHHHTKHSNTIFTNARTLTATTTSTSNLTFILINTKMHLSPRCHHHHQHLNTTSPPHRSGLQDSQPTHTPPPNYEEITQITNKIRFPINTTRISTFSRQRENA
ncbi:salivary glue protein Sgs-3-like [Penaeus indicus]|uniref:salivary glue protein Sgs-3-like n=1 Tax=Penaeus indicus TaxID=29960 RepID=UPI00300C1B06